MPPLSISSGEKQVADFLRGELLAGRWTVTMPGRAQLAKELGVSGNLVEAALAQLERDEWLLSQGPRRRRLIIRKDREKPISAMRVGILFYEEDDRQTGYLMELMHLLGKKGHQVISAARTLTGLGMDVRRVARLVALTPVDAWLIVAGSSEILKWFSEQPVPAFAIHGRQGSASIAATGSRKSSAMAAAVQRLAELGHRRIVLLTREERRKPEPGIVERTFLHTLEAQGILIGPYNLPNWQDSPQGLQNCLSSLFGVTPPTALIASGANLFAATQQFLLNQGIRVPQDVSIVCGDPDASFAWCLPSISHISYDPRIWVRNIMRWVDRVAAGQDDRRQMITHSKFVEGGTIGPAPVD